MKPKPSHGEGSQKTVDAGDEVVSGLTDFAKDSGPTDANLIAIGAFSGATPGYLGAEKIPLAERVEVLSLVSDAALEGGEVSLERMKVPSEVGYR